MQGFSEIVLKMSDVVTVQREKEGTDIGIGEDGERHGRISFRVILVIHVKLLNFIQEYMEGECVSRA